MKHVSRVSREKPTMEHVHRKGNVANKWEDRVRDVYGESLKLMHEGFHGLEVMAAKTVEVGRIKLANQKALQRMRGLFMDLGQRVYEAITSRERIFSRLTPDITAFVEQIKKLQGFIEGNLGRLRHVTTVTPSARKTRIKKRPASRRRSRRST